MEEKDNIVILEDLPLMIKNNCSFNNLYDNKSCNVSVIWIIYNKRKKIVVMKGSSRPCGINHRRSSIHAEQKAIEYCRCHPNRNHQIFIWRYSKTGQIKHKYSCKTCTQLAKKYNFDEKIFTIYNSKKCSAIIDDPPLSLCYQY